jgi:uncharacterized membrane protein YebE (DUF533 family)
MSIVKLNTAGVMPAESKGGNTLLIVLGLAALGYCAYRFWWVPKKEKEKAEAAQKSASTSASLDGQE